GLHVEIGLLEHGDPHEVPRGQRQRRSRHALGKHDLLGRGDGRRRPAGRGTRGTRRGQKNQRQKSAHGTYLTRWGERTVTPSVTSRVIVWPAWVKTFLPIWTSGTTTVPTPSRLP